jgi:hypothetical protein
MKFLVKSIGRSVLSTRPNAFLKTRKPQYFRSGEDDGPNNASTWGIGLKMQDVIMKPTVNCYLEELLK